jgi:hypothetical protein
MHRVSVGPQMGLMRAISAPQREQRCTVSLAQPQQKGRHQQQLRGRRQRGGGGKLRQEQCVRCPSRVQRADAEGGAATCTAGAAGARISGCSSAQGGARTPAGPGGCSSRRSRSSIRSSHRNSSTALGDRAGQMPCGQPPASTPQSWHQPARSGVQGGPWAAARPSCSWMRTANFPTPSVPAGWLCPAAPHSGKRAPGRQRTPKHER